MKALRNIIAAIVIGVLIGWICFTSWQTILKYEEAPVNGFGDWIGHFFAIIPYLIFVIPGLIYSFFPLPKETSEIIIFLCIGSFLWLLLKYKEGNKTFLANNNFKSNNYSTTNESYSNEEFSENPKQKGQLQVQNTIKNRTIGHVGKGKRINPVTGNIQVKVLFGWKDTKTRIDKKSGRYQKKGWFGTWNDTDTKIDQVSGEIRKIEFLGNSETGKKVNPETGIIQEKGLFGEWNNTEERIDPETGKHQKKGWFGSWNDD